VCKQWGLVPGQVVIVGDDMTDMLCGVRAATACELAGRRNDDYLGIDDHLPYAH